MSVVLSPVTERRSNLAHAVVHAVAKVDVGLVAPDRPPDVFVRDDLTGTASQQCENSGAGSAPVGWLCHPAQLAARHIELTTPDDRYGPIPSGFGRTVPAPCSVFDPDPVGRPENPPALLSPEMDRSAHSAQTAAMPATCPAEKTIRKLVEILVISAIDGVAADWPDLCPWPAAVCPREVCMMTDVLIVGAGPTGLMLANQLGRRGVRTTIIDRHSGPALQSRAMAVHARTLEIYSKLGIAERALELGRPGYGANMWAGRPIEGTHPAQRNGKGPEPVSRTC